MSEKKSVFKNKNVIISISFLLVFALAAGIFGLEYSSVINKNKDMQQQLEELKEEKASLASQNSQNQQKINDLTKAANDLQKKIDELNENISSIKAMKAAQSSNKKSSTISNKTNSNNKNNSVKIDCSNLTAPNTGNKICYLTFDDGPSENTLKILKILKQANAKASFFVVGTSKLSYIKQAHSEGHTIALHTNSHNFEYVYKNETNYFNDLNTIKQKVKNIIGIEPNIIRFPGGSSNTVSKQYCKKIMSQLTKKVTEKGYIYVDWNVDSGDASGNNVPVEKLINNIIAGSKNKNQICVLMHDTNAKNTTVSALPQIICYLRSQGFRFEALTDKSTVFHHGINN